MSEFRKDPVLNIWSIIDSNRPVDTSLMNLHNEKLPELDKKCPFCVGNEHVTGKEILRYNFISQDKNAWDLRVFPSKTPILKVETHLDKAAEGIYDYISGVGAYEVIVESNKHNERYHSMSVNNLEQIFMAYHDRIWDLKKDTRLEYILFFKEYKNKGKLYIEHPYSKLIGTPFVPPLIEKEMINSENYFKVKERCVFCDIVKSEIKAGVRLVARNENFVALCPYASRKPFEIWILPINHLSHFETSTKMDYYGFSEIFSICSKKINTIVGCTNFSFAIHNSPLKTGDLPFYHWHLEMYPDIVNQSVLHIGSGMHVNPVAPELAAKTLREESY